MFRVWSSLAAEENMFIEEIIKRMSWERPRERNQLIYQTLIDPQRVDFIN